MRKSSARALQADLFSDGSSSDDEPGGISGPSADSESSGDSDSTPLRSGNFGLSSQAYADVARRAGRLNASHVSEEEHQSLLRERQLLLDRKFSGEITKKETNRLEYIRWSLDRIEDAKFGPSLDILEDTVARYEVFLSEVDDLKSQLSQRMKGARR